MTFVLGPFPPESASRQTRALRRPWRDPDSRAVNSLPGRDQLAEACIKRLGIQTLLLQLLQLLELRLSPRGLELPPRLPPDGDESGLAQVKLGVGGGALGVGHGAVVGLEAVEVEGGVGGCGRCEVAAAAGAATGEAARRQNLVEEVGGGGAGAGGAGLGVCRGC